MFNLTKIICTIGPATKSVEKLEQLMNAGMDVARLNFSHGSHADHLETINNAREAAASLGNNLALLADLCGPKIRVGELPGGEVAIEDGETLVITTRLDHGPSATKTIPTVYRNLPRDVRPGATILLDDGNFSMQVLEVTSDTDVLCKVIKGGLLKQKKGINLPNLRVSAPPLSEKDLRDLGFALDNGIDYVALSFVRHASDIDAVKSIIHERGLDTPVIAKIESVEAVDNLESILKACDGVMVARGDMAVEIAPEKVPPIQKLLVKKCIQAGKPVIVATQMLESMKDSPMPTRAEASDVANAILDGADAIMLSAETSVGRYPVETVAMMSRIATEVEPISTRNREKTHPDNINPLYEIAECLCHATTEAAIDSNAKAIVTYTESGSTALLVSKYRPGKPILAVTGSAAIARRINLYWGVSPVVIEKPLSTDSMIANAEETAIARLGLGFGDHIVITGGIPVGAAGTTNMLKIHKITRTAKADGDARQARDYQSGKAGASIRFDAGKCSACGRCVSTCAHKIYGFQSGKVFVDEDNAGRCAADGLCEKRCPTGAIRIQK